MVTRTPTRLLIVAHTHWDREWYRPFEEFRVRFVSLVDRVIAILVEQPDFTSFLLDAQSALLEDYLAVRPDRTELVRELTAAGRLLTGPWYTMPDEFLVSGESIIRNLLLGTRLGGQFGRSMPVGYLPDPFGHVFQLPQILRGFGIDSAVLWRGVGGSIRQSEFTWLAPDGSDVTVIYLPQAYNNAARLPTESPALVERLRALRDELSRWATTDVVLLMHGDDHLDPQPMLPDLVAAANREASDFTIEQVSLPQVVEQVRASARERGVTWQRFAGELRSPELSHLLAGVLSTRMWLKQQSAASERLLERWAEPFAVFADWGVPDAGQRPGATIGTQARPLLAQAWRHVLHSHFHDAICGCGIDQVDQEVAVRFEQSRQIARQIADEALTTIVAAIDTAGVPRSRDPQSERSFLVVFNSEQGPRHDYVEAVVQPPTGASDFVILDHHGTPVPHHALEEKDSLLLRLRVPRDQLAGVLKMAGFFGGWSTWKLKILERVLAPMARGPLASLFVRDMTVSPGTQPTVANVRIDATEHGGHDYDVAARGLTALSALISRGDVREFVIEIHGRGTVRVGFIAPSVPAHGYSTFQVVPGHRARLAPVVSRAESAAQNEFFGIQVDSETGALTVLDKQTGAIYAGLNTVVDGADAGDEYTYSPPPENRVVSAPAAPPRIELFDELPARARLVITSAYDLPRSLTDDRQTRSSDLVRCAVVSTVTLYPGVRRIDIRTDVDNLALDHRLRVHFPLHIRTTSADAAGHFGVVARPIDLPPSGSAWLEDPVSSHPQHRFVDVSDGQIGLAIATRGLPEYDVTATPDGVDLAITLLRCVGWLSRDDLTTRRGSAGPGLATPGAQGVGAHTFEYCLIPHVGTWQAAAAPADWFASPLRAVTTREHGGQLPAALEFVGASPHDLVISAVKPPEEGEGAIVRLYNPLANDVDAVVRFGVPISRVETAHLDESPTASRPTSLGVTGIALTSPHEAALSVPAGAIATLRVWPNPRTSFGT